MAPSSGPQVIDIGAAAFAGADRLLILRQELSRLLDDMLHAPGLSSGNGGLVAIAPPMSVIETDQQICVDVELPGIAEHEIEVQLDHDLLTMQGVKRAPYADVRHHVAERSFGQFARTVRLPFPPAADQVRATFEDGVLHLVIPKPMSRTERFSIAVRREISGAGEATGCFGVAAAIAGHPTVETTQEAADRKGDPRRTD